MGKKDIVLRFALGSSSVFFLVSLILLQACGGDDDQKHPSFVNYAIPSISVDLDSVLAAANCGPGATHLDDCGILKKEMGCTFLRDPIDLFGGVQPAYPAARCVIYPQYPGIQNDPVEARNIAAQIEAEGYISRGGCDLGWYKRYVVLTPEGFVPAKTADELRNLYAPITTPDEALSFVLLATELEARFGQTYNSSFRYFLDTIEDTHVDVRDDDFEILLYFNDHCNCGLDETMQTRVRVTRNGEVSVLSESPAYGDPALDNSCP